MQNAPAGQTYCKMLKGQHSAILLTFTTFVLSIFEWPLKTGFSVFSSAISQENVLVKYTQNLCNCL